MHRLREMGLNTLLLDHEWRQAITQDWALLDCAHRLAAEVDLVIVPWLILKSTNYIGPGFREELFEKMYGVDVVFGESRDGSIYASLFTMTGWSGAK